MITQNQANKLFDAATEIGVATALDVLENVRQSVTNHDGEFIDGFDYAISALQKTNEIVKGDDNG